MGIDTNDDDLHGFPAAPKGNSGPGQGDIPPSEPFTGGGAAWESGSLFPPSSPFSGGDPLFPLTGPYADRSGEGASNPIFRPELDRLEPPPPIFPTPSSVGARERPPNRNTALLAIGALLAVIVVAGGLGYLFLSGGNSHGTGPLGLGTSAGPTATVGPTATPTLLPHQTPLPTPIPTPALPQGSSYAGSAVISFTRVTQKANPSPGTVGVSTGASDSRLKVVSVNDSADGSANVQGLHDSGSQQSVVLTVTNTDSAPENSFGGNAVNGHDSQGNVITCILQGSTGNIQPNSDQLVSGGTATQTCVVPQPQAEPNVTYDPSYSKTSFFTYSGYAPACCSAPRWYVPQNCGSPDPATQAAAKTNLVNKLNGEMSGSAVYLSVPDLAFSNLTCSPNGGQTITSGNTFTQTITATGSEAGYFPDKVVQYQQAQVSPSGSGWQVIGTSGCSPSVQGGATLTSATVACQATGTEAWNAFDLAGMAKLIAGQNQVNAKAELNNVQGVVPNSEQISLSGGNFLPTNVNNITFHYSP